MGTITSRVTTTPAPPACAALSCASARAPTPVPSKTAATSGAARRRMVTSRGSVGLLAQALIDQAQRRVHVVVVHDERRREPQRALAGAEQQEALLERPLHQPVRDVGCGLARRAVLDELDADHQAASAHLADRCVPLLQPLRAAQQPLAQARYIGQQLAL